MADYKTPTKPAEVPGAMDSLHAEVQKGLAEIKTLQDAIKERDEAWAKAQGELTELKTKAAAEPDYSRITAGIIGGLGRDSEPYSISKAVRYTNGMCDRDGAKVECDFSDKLNAMYKSLGWAPHEEKGVYRRLLVPFSTALMPRHNSESERTVLELRQKMIAGQDKVDPDEVAWIQKRLGRLVTKDIGTINDTQGGVLVGFPTLGELIDLQRNIEAFASAGATEIALPPNGRLQYPKLTNSTTANWVGEAATIPESTPATGFLDLLAKKLAILTDINNELVRFGTISAESLLRGDMAKVAALKLDLAMLEGTGGTQIKGLITYDSAPSWTFGQDKLLTHSVTANTIQIADAAEMEAKLPDTAGEPTAWIMRRQLFAKIRNRRASAAVTTDGQGPFLANITRDLGDRIPLQWDGTKVVRTSQVSATRGSGSNTYALLGHFPDWIIARFGALEFLSSMVGDTQMTNDQTRLRCIQHIDAGARHASSFVFADDIAIQ
jgi:HK97 family phage major capsid protein